MYISGADILESLTALLLIPKTLVWGPPSLYETHCCDFGHKVVKKLLRQKG